MTTIDNYISGVTEKPEVKAYGNKELDQNDFMKLLGAQLQHQDPMKPMENGEFIAEMAQFSQLENSKDLTRAFKDLSNTLLSSASLQASLLVGKGVSFNTDNFNLAEEGANITAYNPVSGNITVNITSDSGEVVHSSTFIGVPGNISYSWDGAEGVVGEKYFISANNASMDEPLMTQMRDRVESVDISGNDIVIKLANNGQIGQDNIIEITEN